VSIIALVLFLAGCPSDAPVDEPPPRPPESCNAAPGLPDGDWFTDASDDIGLRDLLVDGNRLAVTDFDDDGWPDLVVSRGSNGTRDVFDGSVPRQHFLLRNLEGAGFEDVLQSSGFSATRDGSDGRAWNFAVFGDLDNDGDTDGITLVHSHEVDAEHPDNGDRSEVLLNNGDGTFTLAEDDVLQASWLNTTAASLLDSDRDGVLDVFLGNQYGVFGNPATSQQDRLLTGRGDGRFRDATIDAGLETVSGGAASVSSAANYSANMGSNVHWASFGSLACDVDSDGDTDLMSLSYGRGLNQFWENQGDGSYVARTESSGFHSDFNEGGGDYNTDERFRCHCQTTNYASAECQGVPAPRIGCSPGGWNPGWDDQPHRLGGNTFAATCADFDGDGDMDVATGEIRHWWTPGASDPSNILWNDGGSPPVFSRLPRDEVGIEMVHEITSWNEGDLTVTHFDFDGDGIMDLLRPQSDYPETWMRLFRGLGGGEFTEVSGRSGLAFQRAGGVALADFDRDGDLDVFTGFSRMRCDEDCLYTTPEVHYFRNDVGHTSNVLNVRLRGAGGVARDAVGARVEVTIGGVTQVQELLAGHGHQGQQNELVLSFGLGSACSADSVSVVWPDAAATRETWESLPANYDVTFTTGEAQPAFGGWTP
jgi:enediyne biosynthesis protein E4